MTMILKSFLIVFVSAVIISSCSEDDGVPYTFNAQVDATGSVFADHQSTTILQFSIDGENFTTMPALEVGDTYMVRVFDTEAGEVVTAPNFTFDWSGSDPAPSESSSDLPQFTLGKNNVVKVKLKNTHCAYNAASWIGDWSGLEHGACCGESVDDNTIVQDPGTPNRFIISNFWADGPDVTVYADFTPSTNFFDQIVTVPEQETSEGGIASGEGTYDQCAGTFAINVSYKIGGKTYEWEYIFSK